MGKNEDGLEYLYLTVSIIKIIIYGSLESYS